MSLAALCLPLLAQAGSDDWPQFRGPEGNGVLINGRIPADWSTNRNLAWKVKAPGSGWSQPIMLGSRVFLTCAVSDLPSRPKDYASGTADPHTVSGGEAPAPDVNVEWKVVALDLQSGNLQWSSTLASGKPKYPIHPSNTYASETPVADAHGIYAWFGAAGTLAALDHTGHTLWRRELGAFRLLQNLGGGSSLRLHQGFLYLQCFNEEQTFLVCLDAGTGNEKWRVNRDKLGTAWTTPLIWRNERRIEIIACGQQLITSHDPLTGRELWRGTGVEMGGPSSATADRDHVYFGFKNPLKETKLYALNAGAEGDQTAAEGTMTYRCEAWAASGAAPGMSSPVAADGHVYVVNESMLSCHDATTGKECYKKRLPGFRCEVASPVVVGDRVVFVDESGSAVVLKTGASFEILGRSKLPDVFWASPAVAANSLVLRGVDFVYCIRE